MRVLFANDYDMVKAREGFAAGSLPAHHLYGTAWRHDVVDVSGGRPRAAPRFVARLERSLGDLGQQLAMLRWATRRRDVVWLAGTTHVVRLLLFLRSKRLVATPIVVVVHRLPDRRTSAWLAGADAVVAMSPALAEGLRAVGVPEPVVGPWGPDLEWEGYDGATPCGFVVSAGKTRRDLETLVPAIAAAGVTARLYSDRDLRPLAPPDADITVRPSRPPGETGQPPTYDHVLEDVRGAEVFVIPLTEVERPVGLTEVNDALALARPVIVTRNPLLGVDVDDIGCGITVDRGDVAGWRAALERLMSDEELRLEMGRRGRAFAERGFNARAFAAVIDAALARADARRGRRRPSS